MESAGLRNTKSRHLSGPVALPGSGLLHPLPQPAHAALGKAEQTKVCIAVTGAL